MDENYRCGITVQRLASMCTILECVTSFMHRAVSQLCFACCYPHHMHHMIKALHVYMYWSGQYSAQDIIHAMLSCSDS